MFVVVGGIYCFFVVGFLVVVLIVYVLVVVVVFFLWNGWWCFVDGIYDFVVLFGCVGCDGFVVDIGGNCFVGGGD